jgi:hypothetical protein
MAETLRRQFRWADGKRGREDGYTVLSEETRSPGPLSSKGDGTWPESLSCFACHRRIPEDTWFARIKLGDRRVVFCRPRCVEMFLEATHEAGWN